MTKQQQQTADKLNEISTVVMTAGNPQTALLTLKNTLSKSYQPAVEALQTLLTGENFPKIAKRTPWQGLQRLADSSKRPLRNYLPQYHSAHQAQFDLKNATRDYPAAVSYFILPLMTLGIIYWIFSRRVAPVLIDFFGEFDQTAPALTRFVADGYYAALITLVLVVSMLLAAIFPKRLLHAASSLSPLPNYWQKIPIYRTISRHYQQYLWLTYARLQLQHGTTNPLDNVPVHTTTLSADQRALWEMTWQNGSDTLNERLAQQQQAALLNYQQALQNAKQQLQAIMMSLIGVLVAVAIMAVYLPVFQLGDIIR